MWTLTILAGRPQLVIVGGHPSSTLILNIGAPQDLVSVLWYSSATIDPNTVVGLITKNNVEDLTDWTLEEAM